MTLRVYLILHFDVLRESTGIPVCDVLDHFSTYNAKGHKSFTMRDMPNNTYNIPYPACHIALWDASLESEGFL